MSTWYNRVVGDLGEIGNAINYYLDQLEEARTECWVKGSLEKLSAQLPGITEYRFAQLQEIEAILEHVSIQYRKERSRVFKKYLETYNRQLSSRDADKYVDGEQSVISLAELVNEISLLRNRYLAIMKGLDTKQWQIGHITRLRTAGMEDVRID